MAGDPSDREHVERRQHEKLLKLVTKGFYKELINYGVPETDIVTVATHLLGHVSSQADNPDHPDRFYSRIFKLDSIDDRWASDQRIGVDDAVFLRPFEAELAPTLAEWLSAPALGASFVTPYPREPEALAAQLCGDAATYFCIDYEGETVGFVGAETSIRARGGSRCASSSGAATSRARASASGRLSRSCTGPSASPTTRRSTPTRAT